MNWEHLCSEFILSLRVVKQCEDDIQGLIFIYNIVELQGMQRMKMSHWKNL